MRLKPPPSPLPVPWRSRVWNFLLWPFRTPWHQVVLWHLQALSTALVAFLVWLVVWPPVDLIIREPMIIDPPVVEAGCPITVSLNYIKHGNYISEMGLEMVSRGTSVFLTDGMVQLPQGHHRTALAVEIPSWTPPGSYKVYLVRNPQTPFPTEPTQFESSAFTVVKTGRGCPSREE